MQIKTSKLFWYSKLVIYYISFIDVGIVGHFIKMMKVSNFTFSIHSNDYLLQNGGNWYIYDNVTEDINMLNGL